MSAEKTAIMLPDFLAAVLDQVTADYSEATEQPTHECRRLVELGVISRGLRAMQAEVLEQRKLAERMGWT